MVALDPVFAVITTESAALGAETGASDARRAISVQIRAAPKDRKDH
jgi:hypothetical protein